MFLIEDRREFSATEQDLLLRIALASIQSGLETRRTVAIRNEGYPGILSDRRSSFVTLHAGDRLRGCIGSLEPWTTLAEDVSHNAYAAAFRDKRFQPLQAEELSTLSVQVSILSKPELLDVDCEASLLVKVRPGIDGLILQEHALRGTFLPSVWESLPEPTRFLDHLKLKAGLPVDYWSEWIKVWRYTTESFAATVPSIRGKDRDYLAEMLK
jgi:AmmeMemoRadiSam system protein A